MRHYRWLWTAAAIVTLATAAHLAVAQPGGGGGGGGGFGGGGGGFGGGPPFAMGTVAAVAEDRSGFTVTAQFGPNQMTVNVALTEESQWLTVSDAAVADIVVGDALALGGMPLKLQADSVDIGGGLGQFFMPPPQGPQQAPEAPPAGPQPMAFANVTGTVTNLQPLTVDVNGLAIEIEVAEDGRVTKMTPMDQPTLAVEDKVFVFGQRQGDILTAGVVIVDTTAEGVQLFGPGPGFGGGRRGGRGG